MIDVGWGWHQDMVCPYASLPSSSVPLSLFSSCISDKTCQIFPTPAKSARPVLSTFGIRKLLGDPFRKTVHAVDEIELHPDTPLPGLVPFSKEQGNHCIGYLCPKCTNSPLWNDPTPLLKDGGKEGKDGAAVAVDVSISTLIKFLGSC